MRYYISSERRNSKEFARYVRRHWVMDMTFREDESRIRERTIADNISWIRRFTITLIKQNSRKGSIVGKRKKAAWSFDFLLELLQGNPEQLIKHGK